MDLTQILYALVINLWYLIPLFIVVAALKSSWFKGAFGEWLVNQLVKFFLNKKEYHLFKDVTLPTEEGTTQIDHIIISKYGIFVIETKNIKGWIFGGANQKQWTQKIYKHTSKFQNPLHQNYKHLKTLEACLNVKQDSVFSVIIFIGGSTFKTKMPDNVTFARGGIEYIKTKKAVIFTNDEVAEIVKL